MSSVNVGWLLLVAAGLLDVAWAYAMKLSDGLTQPGWTLAAVLVLAIIVVLMGRAVLVVPVGTAYAVFTGVGAIGTVILGIVMFGESTAFARLACIGLIVVGAVGLKVFPS